VSKMALEIRHLPSFFGTDKSNATVFAEIIRFYLPPGQGRRILDATAGKRRFWENVQSSLFNPSAPYDVVFMDIKDRPNMDVIADCQLLPFKPRTFDAVIYDPPFGGKGQGGMARGDFTYSWQENDVSYGFDITTAQLEQMTRRFCVEAARVLKRGGLLITKCMDLGRKFIHIEIINWLPHFRMIDCIIYAVSTDKPLRPYTRRNLRQSHKLHNYFQVWKRRID